MDKHKLLKELKKANVRITSESRTGDNRGWRFDLASRANVLLYDTGTVVVQGSGPIKERLSELAKGAWKKPRPPRLERSVMLAVSARHRDVRKGLKRILRDWGVHAIRLHKLTPWDDTFVEQINGLKDAAKGAIVLLAPDDIGYRKGHPRRKAPRPTSNIVLQLGMLLAVFGREDVVAIVPGEASISVPTIVPGVKYIHCGRNVGTAKERLFRILKDIKLIERKSD